jgi:Fe-S cluster assembly ATP-binding protein
MEHNLSINNITISVQGRTIVQNVSLELPAGSLVGLMGPNGSGKSTLAYALAGHPKYVVTQGSCLLAGTDITQLSPDARAKAGLLLTFQHPPEIPGVSVRTFFHEAYRALYGQTSWITVERRLLQSLKFVGLAESFVERKLHEGFSGGEKKRLEAAQLLFFKPRCAIIDELDAGLDVDALANMKVMLEKCRQENPNFSALVISHSPELMQRIAPDIVYIINQGTLQASGGVDLIAQVKERGYEVRT